MRRLSVSKVLLFSSLFFVAMVGLAVWSFVIGGTLAATVFGLLALWFAIDVLRALAWRRQPPQ